VALAGIAAGGLTIGYKVAGYADRIDRFDRVEVPGTIEVELDGTGGYSIYHEYAGAYDDEHPFGDQQDPLDQILLPTPTVAVTNPSGDEVDLETYDTKVSYDTSSHEGIGLYTFHVDDPGTYVVETSGETAPGGSEIAVGRGVSTGVITGVITGLLVGFVGVVAGVVIMIVLAVRRGRNRRSQSRPGPQPYPTYGALASWPPGYAMQPPPMRPAEAPPQPSAPPPPPGEPNTPTSTEPGQPRATPSAAAPPHGDPPSLRAQDWSRDDVPLPWSPDQR
jgi:hypothetical protein